MSDVPEKKPIGPTFYAELEAYGLAHNIEIIGQHFSWRNDGTIEFFEDTPQDVIDAVNAVYEAHDPTKTLDAS